MALIDELTQQPEALRDLADYYQHHQDLLDFNQRFPWQRLVLTGMGASYHAAWIASYTLGSLGIQTSVIEAVEAFNFEYGLSGSLPAPQSPLVMISQSGSSGEVSALLEKIGPRAPIVGITNHAGSILAGSARLHLPMVAGEEALIASKTYLNTLALLWLLGRSLAGRLRDADFDALRRIAGRVEDLVKAAPAICERLVPLLEEIQPFVFLGHGPHGVTARQAAMGLAEWAKYPALFYGIGAFRHGYVEIAQPGCGAVVFAPPGRGAESAWSLARDLDSYGARVVIIENGLLRSVNDRPAQQPAVDEFLSPILDIVPIQFAAEQLARLRGFGHGFRYISKVVTQL